MPWQNIVVFAVAVGLIVGAATWFFFFRKKPEALAQKGPSPLSAAFGENGSMHIFDHLPKDEWERVRPIRDALQQALDDNPNGASAPVPAGLSAEGKRGLEAWAREHELGHVVWRDGKVLVAKHAPRVVRQSS